MSQSNEAEETAWHLCLYVNGKDGSSHQAYKNLVELLDGVMPGAFEVTLVDISEDISVLETEQLLAVPTLIKRHPHPSTRLIGDMSDKSSVLRGIGLS